MRRAAVLVALAILVACKIDASIGRDQLADDGSGGAGSSGSGSATSGSNGSGGQGGSGGSGGGSGGGTGSHHTDGTGSSGSDTGGVPLLCQHAGTDSDCGVCRKDHCCDEVIACHDEAGCFCYWDCLVTMGGTTDQCSTHCSYTGNAFDHMVTCSVDMCPTVCTNHPTDPPPTG